MVTFTGGGQSFTLDATPQESHTHNFDVTEHPVETGANIVDHIRPKPREVKLDAMLVDGPLGETYEGGRAKRIYDQLEQLAATGTLFQLNSEQLRYENMVISVLSQTRDKTNLDAVRLSMTLREIRTVATQIVQSVKRYNKAKSKSQDGTKPANPVPRSGLKQIFNPTQPSDIGNQLKGGVSGLVGGG